MTTVDLLKLARSTIPPVGATMAVAVVEHEPGGKLANGGPSGLGGRTRYGAAFLVDGRTRTAPIALFDRQRDAFTLVRILNGEAPQGQPDPTTPGRSPGAVPDRAGPGASDPGGSDSPDPGGVCAGCGGPLLLGRRGQRRRTCSAACRQRARRHPAAGVKATAPCSPAIVSHLPRPSTDPVSLAAPGVSARAGLRRPSNPAAARVPGQRVEGQLGLFVSS